MARVLDLNRLTSQPEAYRDAEWEQAFFQALIDGKVEPSPAEPTAGPDGWPYLFVRTGHDAREPFVRVVDWLSTRGVGLVINAHKQVPDYVFPYGMIWHLKENGRFFSPQEQPVPSGVVEFSAGEKILAGPPTPQFLPEYVRKILREFFRDQDIEAPKILVVSKDQKHYDLCISLESLKNPPASEHQGVAQALAWFLPQHYSLMLVSEKGFPPFVPL